RTAPTAASAAMVAAPATQAPVATAATPRPVRSAVTVAPVALARRAKLPQRRGPQAAQLPAPPAARTPATPVDRAAPRAASPAPVVLAANPTGGTTRERPASAGLSFVAPSISGHARLGPAAQNTYSRRVTSIEFH